MTTTYVPATVNLTGANRIFKGATYDQIIDLAVSGSPVNLAAYATLQCHLRKQITDVAAFLTPTVTWVDASIGKLRIQIAAATTAVLNENAEVSGVYDIEGVNGADILRLCEGTWTMSPEVTR